MSWDFFGLLDQSDREEESRILAEHLARMREERRLRQKAMGINMEEEPSPRKAKEESEKPEKKDASLTDVATSAITGGSESADMSPRETKGDWWSDETGGFDIVKNIAQGWYFDVPENVANTVSPQLDKISPRRDYMMVNLPFLKNYDPARDYVFTMPATEFNALKKEKRLVIFQI